MTATNDEWAVAFGYRMLEGVPRCPCRNPGNYAMLELSTTDPLLGRLRCWCGSTCGVTFDDQADLDSFLLKNGGSTT